jgi:hypothetical protein
VNLVRVIGSLFFLAVMGWGAYATFYSKQMSSADPSLMENLVSPDLSNTTVLVLGFIPVALGLLQIYLKLAKALHGNSSPISNRDRDLPEESPGLSHLDENYMEKYAANFRAEQATKANGTSASSPHQSPTASAHTTGSATSFGRRK